MTETILSEAAAAHFASPTLSSDPSLARFMVGEYARALVQLALTHCERLIERSSPTFARQVPQLLSQTLPWAAAWTPGLARLERRLVRASNPSQVWEVLVPLLVHLAAQGALAEADLQLESAQTLYWSTVKLPEADRIVFRVTAAEASVDLYRDGAHHMTVALQRSTQGVWTTSQAESVGVVWLAEFPIALYRAEMGVPFPLPTGRAVLPDAATTAMPIFAEAGRLLGQYCPAFLPWIAAAMPSVVPLDGTDGVRMSASIEEFPGLTFLSLPAPAVEIAETLVHEASHHYYLALQRIERLHDGSDSKLYYSPIKDEGRSIDLILYAFHAFANAALFHRELLRDGDRRYDRLNGRTFDVSLERLRVLHRHLGETEALTPMGRTMWKPIADRLFGER